MTTEEQLVPEELSLPEAEENEGARDHEAEASLPTPAGETNAPTPEGTGTAAGPV